MIGRERWRNVGMLELSSWTAFDCLPHQLFVAKLKAYGVCGKSYALIWSYLSGRKQRVRVGSSNSEWLLLKKGVPQGSVLGPVLFNLFINDLYAAINTYDLYNYADDNTISACCDSKQQVIDTLMGHGRINYCHEVVRGQHDASQPRKISSDNPERAKRIVNNAHCRQHDHHD